MAHSFVLLKVTIIASILCLNACASLSFQKEVAGIAFVASGSDDFARYMPVIISEVPEASYNRIGQPEVFEKEGRIHLRINPDIAVAYAEKRHFKTAKGEYTNLIYRIHLEKVPFSLLPFNLTSGRNVGLLFIVTLNKMQQPVLLTTVHTCGCYLAIVPTNYLAEDYFPTQWNTESLHVYGADLPGLLTFSNAGRQEKIIIYLKDKTHRVIHLETGRAESLIGQYAISPLIIKPMAALEALILPDDGQAVTMFETSGARQHYVRDSHKPFELLFMSWLAMDVRVGVDKRFGKAGDAAPVFYTSLKFWARMDSDMRDFPKFLDYWGWRL